MPGWPGWAQYPFNPMEGASEADAAAAAAAFATGPGREPAAAAPQAAPAAPAAAAAAAPSTTAVRLRGLPFTSVEQDVLAFFAQHDIVDRIADGPKAVHILTRSNGRPSGQAIVQMREPQDAELAQGVLHGQWMGSRYIEVFLMAPEENEAASAAPSASPTKVNHNEPISLAMGVPTSSTQGGAPAASQDSANQFAGAGMPPPWQLGMWSAAMAGTLSAPPPLGPTDYGAGGDSASWEALFEFLGPDGSAAAMAGLPPPDFAAMGMPPSFVPGMPMQSMNGSGAPTANGMHSAAAV